MWLPPDIDWCPTGSRLDPDWIPTGQKRCPKMQKLVPDWVPTGSRRDPDWIHRSARTHSRTYFSLPRPTLAPIFLFRAPAVHQYPPPSCTKTAKAVLSQTGVLQYIHIECVPLLSVAGTPPNNLSILYNSHFFCPPLNIFLVNQLK